MRFNSIRLIGLVVWIGLSHAAAAADSPRFNWTAFYAGATAGYNWGSTATTYGAPGLLAGGFFPADQAAISAQGSANLRPDAFTGGIELGYNWQRNNFVTGIESDFQYVGLNKAFDGSFGTPFAGTQVTHTDVKADWLFTLRGRFGLAWDQMLVYATGGLAVADIRLTQTNSFPAFPNTDAFSTRQTKAGWVVGGGVEYALRDNWSVKAEYLYVEFDDIDGTSFTNGFLAPAATVSFSHSASFKDNIVRVGVNYRFSGL